MNVLPFLDWSWEEEQHVPLTLTAEGLWSGKVFVEGGALARYVYDRWDETEWEDFKETREASGESIEIESRWLLAEPGLEEVNDVVETWNDLRAPASVGTITGMVVDIANGAPLMDANVSVGGIHTASDYDGRFRVEGIAAGTQRITVYRNLGDYKPAATVVELTEDGVADVTIKMHAAQPVQVTFDVALPEDTPEDAEIRLAGNVFLAGARPGVSPNMPVMGENLRIPTLERSTAGRASGSLELHEGTYLQYFYTVGSSSRGQEYDQDGRVVYRSFVVGPSSRARQDQVATWRPSDEHSVLVTLRVEVPVNTTPGALVAFNAGPSHWMTKTGPNEWTMLLYGFPGQVDQYRYVLGDDSLGMDGSDGLQDGVRTLVYPEIDTLVEERVERWEWSQEVAAARSGEPSDVVFRVTVPPTTARDVTMRLVGDDPALDAAVAMTRQTSNPWLYEAVVPLPGGASVSYWYDRGGPETRSQRGFQIVVGHTGQVVDDWIAGWSDSPAEALGTRPDFITGIYTPDFWSTGFLDLSAATFERISAHNGGWVVVSSVWHYGQFDPPTVEPRRVKAPSVLAPKEDIVAQARIAREKGLEVILGPQLNMEMVPGGVDAVCRSHPQQWLDPWLDEAERFWMWHAIVAEEIGADALVLPGYCFHVFTPVDDATEYADEFDGEVATLVEKVRGVFGGKLIMSGSARDYDFPGLADLVGLTTYDTGHPDLEVTSIGGYVNRYVNDIRRRPSQPLIQWRFHPHTVHRDRRLRSTQGPSDA